MSSETLKHTSDDAESRESDAAETGSDKSAEETEDKASPTEVGGREGPDPTRYGDWEKNGRCIDF